MVEVYSDNAWIASHERFARDRREVEAFRKQFHIPPSGERLISVQTKVLDFIPKYPAISLLLESYVRKSWARFAIPENYYVQRFFTSRIAPSLGPPEKQDADIRKIENFLTEKTKRKIHLLEERARKGGGGKDEEQAEEEKDPDPLVEEGKILAHLLQHGVKEINEMIDFVVTRMYQFVQA